MNFAAIGRWWRIPVACALLGACQFPDDNGDGAKVGSKGLWIANGTDVVEYIPSQFVGGTTSVAPQRVLKSAAFGSPVGLTFDLNGNLWVLDAATTVNNIKGAAMFEFSPTQLAALGTNAAPAPVATITSGSLTSPQQLWIDSNGNGWVTDHNTNTVIVFQQAQLGQSGANFFEPILVISSADFNGPSGIAFDSAGDLWISNNGNVPATGSTAVGSAGTTVIGINAANVPAIPDGIRGLPTVSADVKLSDDGHSSIQSPWTLAFDSFGNLWSSNASSATVVEFSPSNFAATGAPTPAVVLGSATVGGNPSLNAPKGICFDDVGNLAVVNSAGAFGVAFYGEKQLVTGSPTPDTFFIGSTTTLASPVGCAFGTVSN
jgi:secreted PhoX family phosphatase